MIKLVFSRFFFENFSVLFLISVFLDFSHVFFYLFSCFFFLEISRFFFQKLDPKYFFPRNFLKFFSFFFLVFLIFSRFSRFFLGFFNLFSRFFLGFFFWKFLGFSRFVFQKQVPINGGIGRDENVDRAHTRRRGIYFGVMGAFCGVRCDAGKLQLLILFILVLTPRFYIISAGNI
jgi:hypothetical protein